MQDFKIPFDKSKSFGAFLFGLAILVCGIYLYQGRDTIELSYKYAFLFRSTANAAIFMIFTGAIFGVLGLRRFLTSKAGIILNADGFMDHRYLNGPIPWQNIVNFDTQFHEFMGHDIEFLCLVLTPGAKADVPFNMNYKLNQWMKAKGDTVIAFPLTGIETQSESEFKHAFARWIMHGRRPQIRQAQPAHRRRPSQHAPAGFGQRNRL